MPHARPGKEWLHLRDAICMGDTKAVVDVLVGEGIPDLTYDEMDEMLMGLKQGGTDACAVVTEQEFKFAINNMIAQATAVDPMTTFVTERWDRVFNDMVGRASGRIPSSPSHYSRDERRTFRNYTNVLADEHRFSHHADQDERGKNFQETITGGPLRDDFIRRGGRPSHYTDETPQGALESMEARIAAGLADTRGFAQQTMGQQLLLNEALAQMELKVGELAEAVRLMGSSVPAPIVAVVAEVEEAVEGAQEALEGRALSVVRAKAIREHIVGLGANASEENPRSVAAALQGSLPGVTERDVATAIQRWPGGSPLGRSPTIRKPRESTSLEERMQSGYQRPERRYGF